MRVMPSNSSGWFWHSLARETGKFGHLYSPGGQRGPWPWFPYALDTGGFACWDKDTNTFDEDRWVTFILPRWRALLKWASDNEQKPLWAVVPDVIGNASKTLEWWDKWRDTVPFKRAMAVQDGMLPADVLALKVQPDVIAIGGSDEFKWGTLELWTAAFKRVHVLRVNAPTKLDYLDRLRVESCDGTGWNRGTRSQTEGLERWARRGTYPLAPPLTPFIFRERRENEPVTHGSRMKINLLSGRTA